MKIAFQSNQLSMRGTEVALYDYADYCEKLLGHKSVVVYDASNANNSQQTIKKFTDRFDVLVYTSLHELETTLARTGSDLMYCIKSGKRDGMLSQTVRTMVHAVFPTSPHQAHGASFAYISSWLSHKCSSGKVPAVSHIIQMNSANGDLRSLLGIPKDALVIGGYGGPDSFDVPCALSGVKRLLRDRNDIYFLFLNFRPFVDHPRALFLPGSSDMDHKARFIQSCDAMIHARLQGESFGLAVGEFSILNKPVVTYAYSKHTHHINMLGDKGLFYKNEEELLSCINSLPKLLRQNVNWDRYSETCNPASVMADFDRFLIQPALGNRSFTRPKLDISWLDELQYWRFKLQMRASRKPQD